MEKYLAELDDARCQLSKNKAENPFVGDYVPNMNENPALEHDLAFFISPWLEC